MKLSMKVIIPFVFTAVVAAWIAVANGEHAASPSAQMTFENDHVRVVRIVIGPHEKVPMHDVTPRLIVWITDGSLKMTYPNGTAKEDKHKAGDAEWLEAQRHAGENLGDSAIVIEAVILK
jgi:quercetin dioxygenase-like cupin family protein